MRWRSAVVTAVLVGVAMVVSAGCSGGSDRSDRTERADRTERTAQDRTTPPGTAGPVTTGDPQGTDNTTDNTTDTKGAADTDRAESEDADEGESATAVPVTNGNEVRVSDAASLTAALAAVRPGMTIVLADGLYDGKSVRDGNPDEPGRFVAAVAATAEQPITLRGGRGAVLDGGGPGGGYGLHLVGADHWRLEGFTVSSASKGIVLDRSNFVTIDGVRVTDIGAEAVHFRSFSSDNILRNSDIDHTGRRSEQYGEGVYIGSAKSNWEKHSGGEPDRSDRNQVLDNRISATTAESIDIKEGSTGGVIRGNTFDGSEIAGKNSADSWIDVKGNEYLIEGNTGIATLEDGFQVHVQLEGWGERNVFRGNVLQVDAPGVGIWLQNTATDPAKGNVIGCDNQVTGAAAGNWATNHYQPLDCQG
ncbi:hypothetical protein GIS00_17875 [Nakamurella sp. YIM 132087]|uniref:Right handed beta helix domain-containing protein n=1 Tax=Nakamurella alba TaxID=2665158 RepID=A0A7K1FNR4_9ACTN|nr:right-handed parallel beta-helix repeat-containing protein [Nakamurella alba]MTD15807.1 hypothetical protein [Nakamurella alba]